MAKGKRKRVGVWVVTALFGTGAKQVPAHFEYLRPVLFFFATFADHCPYSLCLVGELLVTCLGTRYGVLCTLLCTQLLHLLYTTVPQLAIVMPPAGHTTACSAIASSDADPPGISLGGGSL